MPVVLFQNTFWSTLTPSHPSKASPTPHPVATHLSSRMSSLPPRIANPVVRPPRTSTFSNTTSTAFETATATVWFVNTRFRNTRFDAT